MPLLGWDKGYFSLDHALLCRDIVYSGWDIALFSRAKALFDCAKALFDLDLGCSFYSFFENKKQFRGRETAYINLDLTIIVLSKHIHLLENLEQENQRCLRYVCVHHI